MEYQKQSSLEAITTDSSMPFAGIDTIHIISLLQTVPNNECINGKGFWKTYGKWESLSLDQRNRALYFWNNNLTDATRQNLVDESRKISRVEQQEESTRQAITTKHDKARLLHLRADVSLSADWTRALREKSRPELDNKSDDLDPWNLLAEKFNDYETFHYQNLCIVPNKLNAAGCSIPVPKMQAIAALCHDINPSMPGRPLRDGGWVRIQYRELKGKISLCFNNYRRSGNQEEENPYDEWVKFSTFMNNDVITYARVLFSDEIMDQLGRALPKDLQRDTGAITIDDTYEIRKEKAQARKRQRDAAKERNLKKGSSSSSSSSHFEDHTVDPYSSIAHAIERGMNKQSEETNRVPLATFIMEYGNEDEKRGTMEEMMKMLRSEK